MFKQFKVKFKKSILSTKRIFLNKKLQILATSTFKKGKKLSASTESEFAPRKTTNIGSESDFTKCFGFETAQQQWKMFENFKTFIFNQNYYLAIRNESNGNDSGISSSGFNSSSTPAAMSAVSSDDCIKKVK